MSTVEPCHGFKVCRVCLSPASTVDATSMFEGDKQKAELYEKFSGDVKVSSDKTQFEALICTECIATLEKHNKIMEKIRVYEEAYFAPRRSGKLGFHTTFEFGFNVCRVCLTPTTVEELGNAFNEGAKLAQMMKLVANVDVFRDHKKHECLMCDQCSRELEAAFNVKNNMRFFDQNYFEAQRSQSLEALNTDSNLKIVRHANGSLGLQPSNNGSFRKKPQNESLAIKLPKRLRAMQISETSRKAPRKRLENGIKGFLKSRENACNEKQSSVQSRKFKCHVCSKAFGYRGSLKTHLNAVHEKIKRFECDFCGRKVYRKYEMEKHLKHGHINAILKLKKFYDESRPFRCTFTGCTRFFKGKQHLTQHLDFHSDERPFACTLKDCSKRFKTKYKLDQHVIDHSSVRSFKCFCGKAFKRLGQLKTHKNKIHGRN